jgi:pimeloyl-ACP methyl ester carboxylesterase
VDVVIQSYRHRFGLAAGDPELEEIERRLAAQPEITVPTIALDGTTDGVMPIRGTRDHAMKFTGDYEYRSVEGAGHNLPQEAPGPFARAAFDLHCGTRREEH